MLCIVVRRRSRPRYDSEENFRFRMQTHMRRLPDGTCDLSDADSRRSVGREPAAAAASRPEASAAVCRAVLLRTPHDDDDVGCTVAIFANSGPDAITPRLLFVTKKAASEQSKSRGVAAVLLLLPPPLPSRSAASVCASTARRSATHE